MSLKEEREKMLKGIEKEIENLKKQQDKPADYENRIVELEKEANSLKKELE